MMSQENSATGYSIERLDHLGIIVGVIINGLGFSNKPLSLTPLFFKPCPLWLLFHKGVKVDDFNRFKLGRVLDRCYSYGTELLFAEISLAVCHQEKVDTRLSKPHTLFCR